jgi:hypothetical protein
VASIVRVAAAVAAGVAAALGVAWPLNAQPARPDLLLVELRAPAVGLRVGRCNVFEVTVRNAGPATAAASHLRLTVARPGLLAVEQKTLLLAELGPGQQRVIAVADVLVPEPGPWRITALADPAGSLVEASKTNNERALDVGSVPGLCEPRARVP